MKIKAENITIDWEWVEKHVSERERLGKINAGDTRESVLKHLKEALAIARLKAVPAVTFIKKPILTSCASSLTIDGGIMLSSKELSAHLKGSSCIYAFAVTIGKSVEDTASRYMTKDDHLLGYFLDRIGSFAVESMAKNMEDNLRNKLASEGLSVSMRFSPGYCDWPIEEQFKLSKIIDFSAIGITLTESCMMTPKKSISAVVGAGPKELFSKVKSPCEVCSMRTCDYRRKS
ncbi:MAG: vitamin B12 dependent-methionine synthase activation domain-containing protein [Candidatus Omnitrophica bacterium]|nr:vitamin B12 dependent-methionine synthase activation domain-containing protein [Candidatus Omnitrophota bacterium]